MDTAKIQAYFSVLGITLQKNKKKVNMNTITSALNAAN